MDCTRIAHEILARIRPACEKVVRVEIGLEPVARSAGYHDVPRLRAPPACDRLHMIERRFGKWHDPSAIDTAVVTVAVRCSFQGTSDSGRQAVATFKTVPAWFAPQRTPQMVVVPESGHAAPARQAPKRIPERIIHSPRWPMTSLVHVRLSNTFDMRHAFRKPCPASQLPSSTAASCVSCIPAPLPHLRSDGRSDPIGASSRKTHRRLAHPHRVVQRREDLNSCRIEMLP